MKVVQVINGKVAAISYTQSRPVAPDWRVVEDSSPLQIGDLIDGSGTTMQSAQVAIQSHRDAQAKLAQAKERLATVTDAFVKIEKVVKMKSAEFDLATSDLHKAEQDMRTAQQAVNMLAQSVTDLGMRADMLTRQEVEHQARRAADERYAEVLAAAKDKMAGVAPAPDSPPVAQEGTSESTDAPLGTSGGVEDVEGKEKTSESMKKYTAEDFYDMTEEEICGIACDMGIDIADMEDLDEIVNAILAMEK